MLSRYALVFTGLSLLLTVIILSSQSKPYVKNRPPIFTGPIYEANPPSPGIISFWEKWANVFDKAKPAIEAIAVTAAVSLAEPEDGNEERKPGSNSIGLPKKDVESLRRSHEVLLQHPGFNETTGDASRLFHGTGVVTVAGGEYYAPAVVSIRMLRKTNSTLPVQVFIQSNSEYESEICENLLPSLNAECFVIEDYLRKDAPFEVTHYQLKVLAVLFSSFESLLFLDSDCMALHDPMELISSEPFLSTGLISWPDYWIATEDPVFYTIAGLPSYPKGLPQKSSESGQFLISKKKHLSSLLLAAYYNVFGPWYYYHILSQGAPGEGDKETFLAGAIVLGLPFYRVKEHVGTVGYTDLAGKPHGKGMIQYDAAEEYAAITSTTNHTKPRPFFLHANVPKMNIAHLLDEGDLIMPGSSKKERLRLWGPAESTTRAFGFDIEKTVWAEMVDVACTLEHVLRDFKERKKLCKRAEEHYAAVFG